MAVSSFEAGQLWLIAVGGPKFAGKSTLIQGLIDHYSNIYARPVSYTTRRRRPADNTDNYFSFVDDSEFDKLLRSEALIQEDKHGEYRYGIDRASVVSILASGRLPIHEMTLLNQSRMRSMGVRLLAILVRGRVPDDEGLPDHLQAIDIAIDMSVQVEQAVQLAHHEITTILNKLQ